ncbi:translational GTPase TypA [Candidatus Parcubacteria bacterium]|nr:translational GTPase TypA [Candidatus Parcubacteria bacterium]
MLQPFRNIAIIAHVDHGKTTLVDALLKQTHTFRDADAMGTTIMDSNELERERGITIFSKNASVVWKDVKINLVDTPGHADFGGEVERVMNLVDGCLLLVDAKEGPMPQTKFVLKKALEAGHKIIVVINKIDKKDARAGWVLNKTFDLFIDLGATDEQAHFPVVYASAIAGVAGLDPNLAAMKDVTPLLDLIVDELPAPRGDENAPLQISVANIFYDNFKGRIAVGRVVNGTAKQGERMKHINRLGEERTEKIGALQVYRGLEREEVTSAPSGEIVAISGIPDVQIGECLVALEGAEPLPVISIEEPTVKMTFGANTSPFAGTEGEFSTARHVKERLERELLNDVALRVEKGEGDSAFVVSGRGELHLAILIEKMRREGYELQVSRPQVIYKETNGVTHEPYEAVSVECPEAFTGVVIEKLGKRRGEMKDMRVDPSTSSGQAAAFLEFEIPTRGLIGYRSEFITDTKGQGTINTILLGYREKAGEVSTTEHGAMVSMENGITAGYALANLQERGVLFVGPATPVYVGMVVGENARAEDMDVNPCKEKRLSNMRSKGEGESIRLEPPRAMTLEMCLEFLAVDELLEVTPKSLRIRKAILDPVKRRRQ